MIKSPLKWAGGKTRDMAGEVIGGLRVCGGCGHMPKCLARRLVEALALQNKIRR